MEEEEEEEAGLGVALLTASLIQCVFGFVDFAAGAPPPADFVPAFTTGQCASLDAVCPG